MQGQTAARRGEAKALAWQLAERATVVCKVRNVARQAPAGNGDRGTYGLLHRGFIDSERTRRTARRVNGSGSPALTMGRRCRCGWRGEDSRIGDDYSVNARRRVLLLVRRCLRFGRHFRVTAPPPWRGGDVEAGGYGAPPSRRPPLPFLLLLLPLPLALSLSFSAAWWWRAGGEPLGFARVAAAVGWFYWGDR